VCWRKRAVRALALRAACCLAAGGRAADHKEPNLGELRALVKEFMPLETLGARCKSVLDCFSDSPQFVNELVVCGYAATLRCKLCAGVALA
jgi:hypothetical protein